MQIDSANPRAGGDIVVIGVVGIGHALSHVLQFALAPLLPLLHTEFDASYTLLGLVFGVFCIVSAISQSLIGAVVDSYGARPVLVGGLALFAASVTAMGFALNAYVLFPLAVTAALGNSVFHPANMTILSNMISESRVPRGFAFHSFAGVLGFAITPLMIGFAAEQLGWRSALIGLGSFGLCYTALTYASLKRFDVARKGPRPAPPPPIPFELIVRMRSVQFAFLFFVLFSTAGTGVQTFAIPLLDKLQEFTLDGATTMLSCYLAGAACGNLLGGFIAERVIRYERIVTAGLLCVMVFFVAAATAPVTFSVAIGLITLGGLSSGTTAVARDLMVRRASPNGACLARSILAWTSGRRLHPFFLDFSSIEEQYWPPSC
jgi:FSR family fosmidomycin resistance protein-like MFS transporter